MKKSAVIIPLILTGLFVSFTLGLYVGRNFNRSEIQTNRILLDEPALSEMPLPEVTRKDFPVNINTADFDELCTIPGIGEIWAKRILEYREAHGPFLRTEDLLTIPGMGTQKYESILDYITTGG